MVRSEAPQQPGVGRVDDRVHPERGDVAAPECHHGAGDGDGLGRGRKQFLWSDGAATRSFFGKQVIEHLLGV